MLADFGEVLEPGQGETGDRVEIPFRPERVPKPSRMKASWAGIMPSISSEPSSRSTMSGLLALDVRQVAGDGFKEIGLGDDAVEAAIFVDDDCQADRRLLEPLEHSEDRRRLVNDRRARG